MSQAVVLCNIIEWILGIPLTPAARDAIARHLNVAFMWANQGYPNELMGINQLIAETQQIQYAYPMVIENYRQTRRQQLLMTYQQAANSYNVWPEIQNEARIILGIVQQQPNASSPGLSQEVIESCVDMLAFMITVAQGQNPSYVSKEAKDAVRNMIILQTQNWLPQQLQQLTVIPEMWHQMQAMWPTLNDEQKNQARNIWASQLGISTGQQNYGNTAPSINPIRAINNQETTNVNTNTSVRGNSNITGTDNVVGNSNTVINFLNVDAKTMEAMLKKFGRSQT